MSKIIIDSSEKISKYLFRDDRVLDVTEENIIVYTADGTTVDFIIGDMNSTNSTLVENVTEPENYSDNKYTYEDETWTVVRGWRDTKDVRQYREVLEEFLKYIQDRESAENS